MTAKAWNELVLSDRVRVVVVCATIAKTLVVHDLMDFD
jgi:hypothetical protein